MAGFGAPITGRFWAPHDNSGNFVYNPDLQIDGVDIGPAIVVQNDPNGSYIPISVVQDQVSVETSTDQTLYVVPSGMLSVGFFNDADRNSTAGQFTATVNWSDGTNTSGTVVAMGNGNFGVYVNPTGVSDTTDYTLSVTHTLTGVSDYDLMGNGGLTTPANAFDITPYKRSSSPTAAQPRHLHAQMTGGTMPTLNGATLVNGTLPTGILLTWNSTDSSDYFWIYYTTNANDPYTYLYGHTRSGAFSDTIPLTSLKGEGISNSSSVYNFNGSNTQTYIFTLVATTSKTPPDIQSGRHGTWNVESGTASQQFSVPQVFFIGGLGDGDISSLPNNAAVEEAKLYDYKFGVQMTTFPWDYDERNTYDNTNIAIDAEANIATAIQSDLPSQLPLVLMGQSYGGGMAVAVASKVNRPVNVLDVFDPVAPYEFGQSALGPTSGASAYIQLPDNTGLWHAGYPSTYTENCPEDPVQDEQHMGQSLAYYSDFMVSSNVQSQMMTYGGNNTASVVDFFAPDYVEDENYGQGYATGGFEDTDSGIMNIEFTGYETTNPWDYGLVHISQTYNGLPNTYNQNGPTTFSQIIIQLDDMASNKAWDF